MNTPQVMTITYTQRVILAAQRITSKHNGKRGYEIITNLNDTVHGYFNHGDTCRTTLIPWHYDKQGDRIHDSPLHIIDNKIIGDTNFISELEKNLTDHAPLWSL